MNTSVPAPLTSQELQDLVASQTRALAHWSANIQVEDMPLHVLRKAALVVADDIAAIIGAREEPELAAFHNRILEGATRADATVFRGGRQRADRLSAAVANAVAADWLELDEGYRKIGCHAGLYVLPALLAEAETENLSVKELLRATAIAYEVVTRVARAFVPIDDGIHCHANYSAIGACAAIASARRLNTVQFMDALSGAFTFSIAGPRNHMLKGALVRNTWPAVGAWAGMMSVEWARCGISGLPESAYDGLCVALHATPHPDRLTVGLGVEWAILDGYTKVYACCQHAHSAAEAALELRSLLAQESMVDAIKEVIVEAHPLAMRLKERDPATSLAAKFSLPHVVSAALTFGEVGARSFFSDTLQHRAIAALRQKVRVVPYTPTLPPPNDRPARITINMHNGRSLSTECLSAAGGPDRPFGEDVVMGKIADLTKSAYPRFAPQMRRIIEMGDLQLERGWREVVAEFCSEPGEVNTPPCTERS